MKIKMIKNIVVASAVMVIAQSAFAGSVSGKVSACSVNADGTQTYFLTEKVVCGGSSNTIVVPSNLDLSPSVADQFMATCLAAKVSGETLAVYSADCNSNGKMYVNSNGEVRIR